MTLKEAQFEQKDLQGSTKALSVSGLTTLAVSFPPIPDKVISEFLVKNLKNKPLEISCDNGATWIKVLERKGAFQWSVKGKIQQIHFRLKAGTGGNTDLEGVINYEA